MGRHTIPGGKATPHQTGVRVPLIAYQPGTVRTDTTDHLIDASDFPPTLLQLAGAAPPEPDRGSPALDGHSFAPTLTHPHAPPARTACFFWYDPRPGHGKKDLGRHIFALDHHHKLYHGGDLHNISGLLPTETRLDPNTLSPAAQAARDRLQTIIDTTMLRGPISDAARRPPVADEPRIPKPTPVRSRP